MSVTGSTSFTDHQPARMPAVLARIVMIGIMMSAASTRGNTRCEYGDRPRLSSASICSVTRIVPSWAA